MDLTSHTVWVWTLMLLMARMAGIFCLAPVFSSAVLPAKLRYAMCVVLALGAISRVGTPVVMHGAFAAALLALGGEAVIGAVIGFVARAIFAGVELAAVHIGRQMGLTLGQVFAPGGDTLSDPMTRLMYLLACVVFLAVGGHRGMLSGLLGTLRTVPPASSVAGADLVGIATGVLAASFVLAVKIAAPVVIALMIVGVVMGVLSRTMPQLNVLTVELPIRVMVGLLVLAAALVAILPLIERAAELIGMSAAGLVHGPA